MPPDAYGYRGDVQGSSSVSDRLHDVADAVGERAEQAKVWLDSPAGRRTRTVAARAMVLAVPIVLKHPFFKTPVGRLVEVAGGVALVAKVADAIRDWEPAATTAHVEP
jgi:hypothetical protein